MATRQKGLFKPVPRRNDMDSSMYREIEKIAKDCVESTKERFKNEALGIMYRRRADRRKELEKIIGKD